MNNNLKILITGATGKLGLAMVENLHKEGHTILATSRDIKKLEKLEKKYINLKGINLDLMKEKSYEELIKFFNENNCWPECIINNARNVNYLKNSNSIEYAREKWKNEFILDVIVPYEISIAIAKHPKSILKKIINVSSIYGVVGPNLNLYNSINESPANYGVSKAALIHLSKDLAIRLSEKKICVNALSLGGIEGRASEDFVKKYSQLCPAKRMLKENDAMSAIKFLISNETNAITGQNIIVDGGWTIW